VPKQSSNKLTVSTALFATVVLVALLLVLALFTRPALQRLSASTQTARENSAQSLAQKELVRRYEIHEDSGTTPVNAVQARGAYPADKLDYVGIEAKDSNFAISAEAQGGSGRFSVARGSIQPMTGDHVVATLVFRLKNGSDTPDLLIGSDSALVASDTTTNILGSGSARVYAKVAP
jgi:hypothetical protein